jgi:hypothetical protein
MMKLYGRAGLYDDWIRFQAEARKQRRQAAIDAKKKRDKMWEYAGYVLAAAVFVLGIVGMVVWVKFLKDGGL